SPCYWFLPWPGAARSVYARCARLLRPRVGAAGGEVMLDRCPGRGVLRGEGLLITAERGGDIERELLAEFHAPLVEGVDSPHRPLHEGDVLVQRDELPEHGRAEFGGDDRGRGPVARKGPGGDEILGGALGAHLLGRLAERERASLGEEVRHEQVVHVLLSVLEGMGRAGDGDEIRWDEPSSLVDELVERVLAVGARLPPEHLPGVVGD